MPNDDKRPRRTPSTYRPRGSCSQKAAGKGHSGAMFALGVLYGGDHDLPMDRMAALRWFRAAAELGHGPAQLMLGRYLASGPAGERNPVEARDWLESAAAQGITDAESDLAELSANHAALT